jgi:hypothetical protein
MAVLGALLPVYGLIALGFGLRARRFLPADFWRGAERFTYFIAFPALLFREGAKADFGRLDAAALAVAALGPVLLAAAVAFAAAPALVRRIGGPAYSSLLQAAIRPNTYLALAVAAAIGGAEGPAVVAAAIVLVIPAVNVLSVVAVTRYGGAGAVAGRGAVAGVAGNPLIVASLAGLLSGTLDVEPPAAVSALVELLARPALPLGLLAVGAALRPSALLAARGSLVCSAIGKLVVLPAVAGLLCLSVGLAGFAALTLTAYAAMPASPSSYVLARELGGDADLMAGLITAHTVASAVTLPLVIGVTGVLLGG